MPDYFLPFDPTLTSHYLNELYTSTSIQEYTFSYGEMHKEELLEKGFDHFLSKFVVTDQMLSDLVKVGERNMVMPDNKVLTKKEKLFKVNLKEIGRVLV